MNTFSLKIVFFRILLTGVAFIALSASAVTGSHTHHVSGFLTFDFVNISDRYQLTTGKNEIVQVTGKLGGRGIGTPVKFKSIWISPNTFLAQTDGTNNVRYGVFFEIDNGKIRLIGAVGCKLPDCQHRNVVIDDSPRIGATSATSRGYGVFDLTLLSLPTKYWEAGVKVTKPVVFLSDFITTQFGSQSTPLVSIIAQNIGAQVDQITGKLGGGSIGGSIAFTAIKLGHSSFLAQANAGIYKKGVFFTVNSKGRIKVTNSRYCRLTECRNRNLLLSDKVGYIATNHQTTGYGIFDLAITLMPNLAYKKFTIQSSTYGGTDKARRAVDGNTNGSAGAGSVTHTNSDQSAWWRVNLGSEKLIQKINIFNRTDCCSNRLTNYRVKIYDNWDNIVYQQNFNTYPNPKQAINLGMQNVVGRVVKIELVGTNFLSLAEVQVLGFETGELAKEEKVNGNEEPINSKVNEAPPKAQVNEAPPKAQVNEAPPKAQEF